MQDVAYPVRFSWALAHSDRGQAQTAYQVQVYRRGVRESLMWDSGRVSSNQSQNVHYGGSALGSDTALAWSVRVWDTASQPSPWAVNATFSTGLYTPADWKGAAWIGIGAMAQLRKEFAVKATFVTRATAYVVGLGYYKLFVDGTKVSDHELGAFTMYERRVYYDTWDATT